MGYLIYILVHLIFNCDTLRCPAGIPTHTGLTEIIVKCAESLLCLSLADSLVIFILVCTDAQFGSVLLHRLKLN